MGTTLAALRTALRTRLDDAGSAVWSDAELDTHIQAALKDLAPFIPHPQATTLATVAGSREVNITTLTNRLTVEAVEYKTGNWPPSYVSHSIFADTLYIETDPAPDGSSAKIYWTSLHVLNGSQTLPTRYDEILLDGAAAAACRQQHADTVNAVTDSGTAAPHDWATLANNFQTAYEAARARARGIRSRYTRQGNIPATDRRDSDPGL